MEIRHLHVKQHIDIAADAINCYEALTGDISAWWGSPYLLIERPETRITLEPRLGGLVREHADGDEASWGTVTEIAPGRMIAWTGRMGLGDAVVGTVRLTLTETDGGTRVDLEHESIGAFGPGAQASYEHGWADLLRRVRAFIEHGESYGVSGRNAPQGPDHLHKSALAPLGCV